MSTFIANPDRFFKRWNLDQIFKPGKDNAGPYVPNVGDLVVDVDTKQEYEVVGVDYQTGVSTLERWVSRKTNDPVGITDHFVSAGTGTIQDTWRLLVDTSKQPYVANLDSRLTIRGANASYVVIYKKEDVTSEQAEPLSMYFDDTDSAPVKEVPLTINKAANGTNPVVKECVKFYANQSVSTNDIVTLVVYDSDGNAL